MTAHHASASGLLQLLPDISGEDTPPLPVGVASGRTCCGCTTRSQRLWKGRSEDAVLCTLCWLTLNLDSPTAAHGHLAWLPDAPAADIINLQRRALIGLRSESKSLRKESRRVWNWLFRHTREVEKMWKTSRAGEFAAAMRQLPPDRRAVMQQRLEGCVLILPPDMLDDLTLLLPLGRTAENAVSTPAWTTYIRSDLYAKPLHQLD